MQRRSIEVEGRNVESAIKKALKDLKAKREEVEIKVLCEEEKGLFGMDGAKPARVRASLKKH